MIGLPLWRVLLKARGEVSRWGGDGLHCRDGGGATHVNGWSIAFGWLGLHIEIDVGTERN